MARDGFGEDAAFHSLLALDWHADRDSALVGFATWYGIYSTFGARRLLFIEDLFVHEAWRGRGIGGRLLARLALLARARGYGGLALSVLAWNPAREVYRRAGFEEAEGWLPYRLVGKAFEQLAARASA